MKLFNRFLRLKTPASLSLYRTLLLSGGFVYLFWWGLVEAFLPGSFNPLGSRIVVVSLCWLFVAASFFSLKVAKSFHVYFAFCFWVVTAHYYYLFHGNHAGIDWVVGAYVTIIATCTCLQTEKELLSYMLWVLFLSATLTFIDRSLIHTVFLPGTFTILFFSYLGLRSRLRWLERSRETSAKFQKLFDSVSEGIVVHEAGLIKEVNESFASIFGYPSSEVIGMNVADFVVPSSREDAVNRIHKMSEAPYQTTGLRKNGSQVPLEIRAKKHVMRGKVLRLAAVTDLTDRIKGEEDRVLYEASQSAIQMRDEFLSIASHELKTPLTNIKLHAQMALRSVKKGDLSVLEPAKMQDFIQQTDRQADRLARLVEEMLDVSRISAGKLSIEPEDVDLTELVNEVVRTFEVSIRQSRSAVQVESQGPSRASVDRFRMEQVVSNLLSNAVKYGEGKPIRVRLENSDHEARISVEDQGPGISIENQARIFQRFERAASPRKVGGLGLGLYIAKDIVEAHHGHIELQSELNQGSKFTVVLPALRA